jgi:hypothetical protein
MSFTFYLELVTDDRVDINGVFAALLTNALLLLPLDALLVVRQRNVEVERLVPFIDAEADESVLPPTVLNAEHEVAGGVEHNLDDTLPLTQEHEAGSEETPPLPTGHHTEADIPDLVQLQPLAALVASTSGAGWDLVHRHLVHYQQPVLKGLFLLGQQ